MTASDQLFACICVTVQMVFLVKYACIISIDSTASNSRGDEKKMFGIKEELLWASLNFIVFPLSFRFVEEDLERELSILTEFRS